MTNAPLIELILDGKQLQVQKGTTVYQAAKNAGIEIPIFCYHEKMPPFGACRMCLVEVEKMPKLQASCTLEVTDGMRVNTQTQMAIDGRKDILEPLLINHPLDCPICDRGGECPLQDNALKYGPGLSRFFEEKRHFKKRLPLGPVLMLDRERCIVCARCTRFGEIIAGDHALGFIERGYRTEVGTKDGLPVESKFIGNTIMICPVGALTSQVYRFRARPWDNATTESSCSLCPVGCSLKLDARDGEIMRTRSSENRQINDIWLCDKGWFGYEHADHPDRLTKPLIRKNNILTESSWEEAISLIVTKINAYKEGKKIAALGGNPLTTEENYLFAELFRKGIGVNHIDHRVGMPILEDEGFSPIMQMPIGDLENASLIVLLGADITEEFPVIWLRVKQALNKGSKVIFIGHYTPEIAPQLSQVVIHAPGDELDMISSTIESLSEKGVFLVGRQYLASANRAGILTHLRKYSNFSLNLLEGRNNSLGARFAGMRPDSSALGRSIKDKGLDAVSLIQIMSQDKWDLLYVAGADPATKFPQALWQKAKQNLNFLVVQDLFLTETASLADVVLPTLTYTEKKGSFINIEGRNRQLYPGKIVPNHLRSDGEIFLWLAQKLNTPLIFEKEFKEALKQEMITNFEENICTNTFTNIHADLRATFSHVLFDQGVRMRHNEHLSQNAKPAYARIHPSEGEKRQIPNGAKVLIKSENQASITANIKWDMGVALKTVVIPLGFNDLRAQDLSPNLINGLSLEMEVIK